VSQQWREFSHVANFTGYMEVVADHFAGRQQGLKVLDLPAGNGLLSDALRTMGHTVICGDINRERTDYRYVDMTGPLPFTDGEFDAVICLEGLEHLVDPARLIADLVRITRPGGEIVITTPNVMSFYSRLHYLFTGTPYQFNPALVPQVAAGVAADRGHVSPLSYFQLRHMFSEHGAPVKAVLGDRFKRKILFPLYFLLFPMVWLCSRALLLRQGDARYDARNRELYAHSLSAPLLFSRSLILVLEKKGAS
jgi:SAM-dependent methyltransferase